MAARPGKAVFHIGPERDLPIFDGLGLRFVPMEQADYVVCTGLRHDEVETAEDYRQELAELQRRNLFMVCGNTLAADALQGTWQEVDQLSAALQAGKTIF